MEEGIDFYFNEAGLMVLTAHYLRERGYCCRNRCTHCPWNYGKDKKRTTPENPQKPQELHGEDTNGE